MAGYGKVFQTMYTGSMYGAGMHVFAVWGWVLAHKDENGMVEVNPDMVAHQLGGSAEDVAAAITVLTSPDPNSRSTEEEGRRMVKTGQFMYKVVNHAKYRDQGPDRTEYWRKYRQEERRRNRKIHAKVKPVHCEHVNSSPIFTHADADADADAKADKEKKKRRGQRFTPPSCEEVSAYAASRGFPQFDGRKFVEYYETGGWKDAHGNPVRNWKQKFLAVWEPKLTSVGARPIDKPCRGCKGPADFESADDAGMKVPWCRNCQPRMYAKLRGEK